MISFQYLTKKLSHAQVGDEFSSYIFDSRIIPLFARIQRTFLFLDTISPILNFNSHPVRRGSFLQASRYEKNNSLVESRFSRLSKINVRSANSLG